MAYSSSHQVFTAKDRPVRPFRRPFAPLRLRFILFSLALVLVLVVGGVAVFLYQRFALHSTTPLATIPTPTALAHLDASKLTPTQLYEAVTSRPTLYSSDLSQQDRANWDQEGRCQFAGETYQVFMPASPRGLDFQGCLEKTFRLSDFAFQAQMTINSGTKGEGGGLIFRAQDAFNSYRLRVNLDGSYDLTRMSTTSVHGTSSAIKTGFNQTNLLTVIAQGPWVFLYVNKQFLGEVNNALPNEGQFGFMTVSVSQDTRISWTDVQVWKM
jgi:hypothetical protein